MAAERRVYSVAELLRLRPPPPPPDPLRTTPVSVPRRPTASPTRSPPPGRIRHSSLSASPPSQHILPSSFDSSPNLRNANPLLPPGFGLPRTAARASSPPQSLTNIHTGNTTSISSLKPFQALAVTATGTMEQFGLSDKDLAIMCSSHSGSIEHARQAFNILWRCDVDPSLLQCPIPSGKQSALQYNCSGKHAGMLAVSQKRRWSLNTYLHRDHPIQKLILDQVADLLAMPPAEFIAAHDDCGSPTYMLQLRQLATLYAKLASGNHLGMERIIRAMTHHPTLISGEGRFDTEVMRHADGELVSKSGAEGVQCVARVGHGLGIAIKVSDGAKRAKYAVATHLMKQLGWLSPEMTEALEEQFMTPGAYTRLDVAGDLVMV